MRFADSVAVSSTYSSAEYDRTEIEREKLGPELFREAHTFLIDYKHNEVNIAFWHIYIYISIYLLTYYNYNEVCIAFSQAWRIYTYIPSHRRQVWRGKYIFSPTTSITRYVWCMAWNMRNWFYPVLGYQIHIWYCECEGMIWFRCPYFHEEDAAWCNANCFETQYLLGRSCPYIGDFLAKCPSCAHHGTRARQMKVHPDSRHNTHIFKLR